MSDDRYDYMDDDRYEDIDEKIVDRKDPMEVEADTSSKVGGFLLGLFGLGIVNGIMTYLIGVLPQFITSTFIGLLPLLNIGAFVFLLIYSNRKIKDNDPKKRFYRGLRSGLITSLILSFVLPLLLIGGCFILLAGY